MNQCNSGMSQDWPGMAWIDLHHRGWISRPTWRDQQRRVYGSVQDYAFHSRSEHEHLEERRAKETGALGRIQICLIRQTGRDQFGFSWAGDLVHLHRVFEILLVIFLVALGCHVVREWYAQTVSPIPL